MAFHTADYDAYAFLGNPAREPLWHWANWRCLMPDLDRLLRLARGPASIRSTQYLPNDTGTAKFGRIGWKEKDQQKWTHRSPSGSESSECKFLSAELWAPAWTQCGREYLAPDVFLSIKSEAYFGNAASFEPVVVLAVVSQLADANATAVTLVIRRVRELMDAKLVAHQRRPWGRSAMGGAAFSNSIQDLHVVGLFKPGRPQERPLNLDMFSDVWQPVAPDL